MVCISDCKTDFSSATLRDGSPVLVMHVQKIQGAKAPSCAAELPRPQEPMVVMYPDPTPRQSWRVILSGCAMLWRCLQSAGSRYLRRCNLAHERLAGIRIYDKTDK